MGSVMVFGLVFGGAGLIFFIGLIFKTVVNPKKFHAIEHLIENGNTKAAIRQAKVLLARNERNSDAHWILGESYRAENRPELAVVEYKYIANSRRFTNIATVRKVRARLAEEYLKLGQIDEAQKEYILLSKLEPGNYENYFMIAKLFEERNFADSAFSNYRKVVSLHPNHSESYYRMGILLYNKKMYSESMEAFRKTLKIEPHRYSSYFYMGKILKASGDISTALIQFEKALKDPDMRQRSLLEKANIYIMRNDYQQAINELERALKVESTELSVTLAVRHLLAHCFETEKDLIKAIEQWEWIYERDPNYEDVTVKLALYSDLRADDKLKDFLTAPEPKFNTYCKKIVESLGLAIQEEFLKNQGFIEMTAVEMRGEWKGKTNFPTLIRIFRNAEPIGYDSIRGLYDHMRKLNAIRSICVTASKFTRTAVEFAQIRPIDLIDKEELTKLLHKIPM